MSERSNPVTPDPNYICPQCGPDPAGASEHARTHHTFEGLFGCSSVTGEPVNRTSKQQVRHAGIGDLGNGRLCGDLGGRATKPQEHVNCPACRVILNHVRERYPEHAGYGDWRMTAAQAQKAALDFVADMNGGAND